MKEVDERTAHPLKAMFDRYGMPTYDMVGVQAAKGFVVMVQHQPAEFRQAVVPKLEANVDAGQADPAYYAMVDDRTQRDQDKNQLNGEQLECATLLQRCVPADARVDVYLWIRTATIAASMTA
jgi:hypothetical protein